MRFRFNGHISRCAYRDDPVMKVRFTRIVMTVLCQHFRVGLLPVPGYTHVTGNVRHVPKNWERAARSQESAPLQAVLELLVHLHPLAPLRVGRSIMGCYEASYDIYSYGVLRYCLVWRYDSTPYLNMHTLPPSLHGPR